MAGDGQPPRSGWARLVSELLVENIDESLEFWRDELGFAVAYQRPEQGFVYLERPDGAQIMLCQRSGLWETGTMERPFGRGVLFQVTVANVDDILHRLHRRGWPVHTGPREVWRRYGDRKGGRKEIVVQDPDGYLVMLAQDLGERSLS